MLLSRGRPAAEPKTPALSAVSGAKAGPRS
jgi:hypothetical protein